MNSDIITFTLNPAIDRTLFLEKFEYGQVNRIKKVIENMGGKGINVARVLCSLRQKVTATGLIGKENKDTVDKLLSHEAFKSDWLLVPGKTRTNTKVIDLAKQITTDLNEPGFDLKTSAEQAINDLQAKITIKVPNSSAVIFSGSLPYGISDNIYGKLISKCLNYGSCITVADAEGQALLNALAAGVDIIKPNLYELSTITNFTVEDLQKEEFQITACRSICQMYKTKQILLSLGEIGSLLYIADKNCGGEKIYFAAALKVNLISTVGAGDSMVAGYIDAIVKGLNPDSALARGTACAAFAVSQTEKNTFNRSVIDDYANKVKIKCVR